MSRSYTVKAGDTLLGIAIQHDVDFNQLLVLNPKYQSNPDLIYAGDDVELPQALQLEELQSICPVEPPAPTRPLASDGCLEADPQCKGVDIKNVLFQTDERGKHYYSLDEQSQEFLNQEISETEKLIEAYQEISAQAPDPTTATEQTLLEHANKKKQWAIDAVNAGAIASEPVKEPSESEVKEDISANQKRVKAKIKELERRRSFVLSYTPPFLQAESSVDQLKQQTFEAISQEIKRYEALLTQAKQKTQVPDSPQPSSIGKLTLENFANSKTLTIKPAKRHVVELFSASHNRFVYVRAEFLEREKLYWRKRSVTAKMLSSLKAGNTAAFKQAILKDITDSITKDIETPAVDLVLKQWNADGGSAEEWKASQYILNEDGETRFSTSSEAQLLRWGMGATLKSTVKPTEGKVDVWHWLRRR